MSGIDAHNTPLSVTFFKESLHIGDYKKLPMVLLLKATIGKGFLNSLVETVQDNLCCWAASSEEGV